MIRDLKPYAEYKDSGLPWLGEVPGHWRTERAKWLFRKMDRPVREEDEVVTCFRDGIVTLRRNRRLRGFTEATLFSGYQGIRKGDLVIHGMDAFAGAIGVSDSDGKGTPVYNVCQPREGVNAAYYAHLVREMSQSQWILALAKGIRERSTDFRFEMFGSQFVPLPPPAEQAAIVRFLDWANGRLERAIRAKRKVIALLNEQKQAIIHRAVTRGLDSSVTLKDSGVPWIGEIPEHWEVLRAKYLFREVDSRSETGSETHLAMSQKLGLVPSYMVQSTLRSQSYAGAKLCSAGDLVLNRLKAHLGVFAVANQEGVISPDYTVLSRLKNANTDYYALILRSPACRGELRMRAKGIVEGFWRLYTDDFYDIPLPVPPIAEQKLIIEMISNQTRNQDAGISSLDHEIEVLREYRTRLVADVVTGKLDVREAATRLLVEELPPGLAAADDEPEDLHIDEDPDS